MDATQEMEFQMDSSGKNSPIILPEWYNSNNIMYKTTSAIDFFKVHDDFNQAKLKLMVLKISDYGWRNAITEMTNEILHLCKGYDDLDPLEKKWAANAIQELTQKKNSYSKRQIETIVAKDETKKKYWPYGLEDDELEHQDGFEFGMGSYFDTVNQTMGNLDDGKFGLNSKPSFDTGNQLGKLDDSKFGMKPKSYFDTGNQLGSLDDYEFGMKSKSYLDTSDQLGSPDDYKFGIKSKSYLDTGDQLGNLDDSKFGMKPKSYFDTDDELENEDNDEFEMDFDSDFEIDDELENQGLYEFEMGMELDLYSPFNDPKNDFGWKRFVNLKEELLAQCDDVTSDYRYYAEMKKKRKKPTQKTVMVNLSKFNDIDIAISRKCLGIFNKYQNKINKALLEFCKRYFLEDLLQPIYGGLGYFTHEGITE